MRCVILNRFGAPAEVLAAGEQPTPQPGPGQVRIRMIQSPIHNHDLAIVRGVYGTRPPLPAIPGTEAVGVIDEAGPDTANVVMGQRVSVAGRAGRVGRILPGQGLRRGSPSPRRSRMIWPVSCWRCP
jgi:NADPH:quinone reductase-like Zn-dependent oxidoreductase